MTVDLASVGARFVESRRDRSDASSLAASNTRAPASHGDHDDPDLRIHLSPAARASLEAPAARGSSDGIDADQMPSVEAIGPADVAELRSHPVGGTAHRADPYRAAAPAERGVLIRIRA